MQAWPVPDIPRLPGRGLPVRVFDTATQRLVDSASGPSARMYVCGITPYDATHIGHAATYVAFDLLHRAWRDAGRAVTYVQNVTDIDDPLFERARATGQDWAALAARETELFRRDMAALAVIPPTVYVGALEELPLILDMIGVLRDRGAAYDVDGDLYFPVSADDSFGTVARLDRTEMLAKFREEGGDPDRTGKKDPLDCLLWQRHRPDEPGWDSPFGFGRPGWHIECTAMALHYLGPPAFDVQGGGRDLAFPHHELCAAEGQVATGVRPFARAYVHAGLVGLGGKKMSKSEGNLVFVAKLRERGTDPAAIRLALLEHHYRSDWHWVEEDLARAERRVAHWRSAIAAAGPPAEPLLAEVRARVADDLDAPGALAAVDRWATAALADPGGPAVDSGRLVSATLDALLGVKL